MSIGQITPIIPITAIDDISQQLRIAKTVPSLRTLAPAPTRPHPLCWQLWGTIPARSAREHHVPGYVSAGTQHIGEQIGWYKQRSSQTQLPRYLGTWAGRHEGQSKTVALIPGLQTCIHNPPAQLGSLQT